MPSTASAHTEEHTLRCAVRALTWPFFAWLAGIALLLFPHSFDFPACVYAVKTFFCAGLFLLFRPWRFVDCRATHAALLAGILFGFVVYVLWVLPECHPWPNLLDFYRRWLVMFPGSLPDYSASWCYAWDSSPTLALIKLLGSAFVIAPIEEFFFRGFLMRWLTQRDWLRLPLGNVSRQAYWSVALVFAFEHDRWVGGLIAGLVYGVLAIRTNSLRAPIIAHVTTNFLLGLHVILFDAYGFW